MTVTGCHAIVADCSVIVGDTRQRNPNVDQQRKSRKLLTFCKKNKKIRNILWFTEMISSVVPNFVRCCNSCFDWVIVIRITDYYHNETPTDDIMGEKNKLKNHGFGYVNSKSLGYRSWLLSRCGSYSRRSRLLSHEHQTIRTPILVWQFDPKVSQNN